MELRPALNEVDDFSIIVDGEEFEVLAAACLERTASRLQQHLEPLKSDLKLIEAQKGNKHGTSIRVELEIIQKIAEPLKQFVDTTDAEVISILSRTNPFENGAFLRRYELGQKAAILLSQLMEETTIYQFSLELNGGSDEPQTG